MLNKSAMCVSHTMSTAEGVRLANIIGINVVSSLDKYLGLPCFTGRCKRKLFSDIVDRVWGRIKGWGKKFLSIGGKEILIKAVAQAISTYTMSCFKLPNSLCLDLNLLMGRFWWGQNGERRKIHWVKWDTLCQSKRRRYGFQRSSKF